MQACLAAANEDSFRSVMRVLRSKMNQLPKIEPAPLEAQPSRDLLKLLTAATKEQKRRGEAYLGVDVLLTLLIDQVRSCNTPVCICPESSPVPRHLNMSAHLFKPMAPLD